MSHHALTPAAMPNATSAAAARPRGLYSPLIDFLILGGGSLPFIIPLGLFVPKDQAAGWFFAGLVLAHFINHPHFAHSYQMFYRDFGAKIRKGGDYAEGLRLRYLFAGIVAPVLLTLFFALALAQPDARMLGYGVNAMGFFVGWHYVKQGYGILMVDAAKQRRFFNDSEKRLLLINAYAVWMVTYIAGNRAIRDKQFWGIEHYTFDFPDWTFAAAIAVAGAATLMLCWRLARRAQAGERPLPVNGLVAYGVTLYVWLGAAAAAPVMFALIPAAHSLQYLAVVWRYQWNRERAEAGDATATLPGGKTASVASVRFAKFVASGTIAGFLGFWAIPIFLSAALPYDRSVFGPTAFVAVFWLFINLHHYFLDNVIWRRGNPDVGRHLFS